MKIYKPRKIELNRITTINNWKIKVYTITRQEYFKSITTLESAITKLPEWLENSKALGFETHGVAFLIVHEGIDGVWILINWWICDEILQSMTFYVDYNFPTKFQAPLERGFAACIWELEVVVFERAMWIEHVLKKAKKPDFEAYFHTLGVGADPHVCPSLSSSKTKRSQINEKIRG